MSDDNEFWLPAEHACLAVRGRFRRPPDSAPPEVRSAFDRRLRAALVGTDTDEDDDPHDEALWPEEVRSANRSTATPVTVDVFDVDDGGSLAIRHDVGDFEGLAIPFGTLSCDMGGWRERIAPAAFDLDQLIDVLALVEHNPDKLLGRRASGTLQLCREAEGIGFTIRGGKTGLLRDTAEMVTRRDYPAMSFGMRIAKEGGEAWERRELDGVSVRTVMRAILTDVSIVANPCYSSTSVRMCTGHGPLKRSRRAILDRREAEADHDRYLRMRAQLAAHEEREAAEDYQRYLRMLQQQDAERGRRMRALLAR
jgi:HK97 family phage prohead protease